MKNKTNQTTEYRNAQMIKACPVPIRDATDLSICLHSEHGKSNWLSVTPAEFKLIEQVLEGLITKKV